MPTHSRRSRCSSRREIAFYWNGIPALRDESAIQWAADEILAILKSKPNRRWTPYNEPLVRSEVAGVLESARQGFLEPVRQVKPIDRAPSEFIFEIRIDLQVSEQRDSGRPRFTKARTRVYHSEPLAIPAVFIGLHLHEKEIVPGDSRETTRLQNLEIDSAVRAFHRGEPHKWGV